LYTIFFHAVFAQRRCSLAPHRLWCVLCVSGDRGVSAAQYELLSERCPPLMLPQICLGRRIVLDGDCRLWTGLPHAGRPIGADVGDARAVCSAGEGCGSVHRVSPACGDTFRSLFLRRIPLPATPTLPFLRDGHRLLTRAARIRELSDGYSSVSYERGGVSWSSDGPCGSEHLCCCPA